MVSRGISLSQRLGEGMAQAAPLIFQGRVQAGYLHRWSSLLACSLARVSAVSLLERRLVPGTGEDVVLK